MSTAVFDREADRAAAAARRKGEPVRARQPRRALHGVLLLDKPAGWSSNDALQKVRNLFRAEKAGHTGTLDPLASGLLPICLGAATKFSQVSLEADKAYRATLRLGQRTEGGDREGAVIEEKPVDCDRLAIEAACRALTGPVLQMPPMHSALKHQGRALYEYAREGVVIERTPREVCIHRIDIVEWHAGVPEQLVIDVVCSKGTYIRTLAEDLGAALGCGAHLAALQRTGSGPLRLADAISLDALMALDETARDAWLRPIDTLLSDRPEVTLPPDEAGRFLSGQRRRIALADQPALRVYGAPPRAFLGSAHVMAGELIADRLLNPQEVQAQLLPAVPPTPKP